MATNESVWVGGVVFDVIFVSTPTCVTVELGFWQLGWSNGSTSSARSATLGDTSWARFIFQLRTCISVDRQRHITTWGGHLTWKYVQMFILRIKDRAECVKGTGLHGGRDTAQNKHILGGGDTAHILLMRRTIGVGTPHNIERKTQLGGLVGSGQVGSCRK